jgi:multicomponent Na+:H+ antiporter subunit F
MTILYVLTFAMLAAAGLLCVVRMLRGRSFPDRAVALDTLLVVVVCGIAVDAARTGDGTYLDVLVVAALLGFTGTALVARFIERRGAR